MGLFNLFVGQPYDPEDDELALPLTEEAEDLPLHVKRCAGRFKKLRKGQHANGQLIRVTLILVMLITVVILLANGEKAISFVKLMF